MKSSQFSLESILGVTVRARRKAEEHDLNQFLNLIVHREIKGDRIYVPLDVKKL